MSKESRIQEQHEICAKYYKELSVVTNMSGIYVLTRVDEQEKKYCYVGQSKHVRQRLVEHLCGWHTKAPQHIDLSLKKHGFYTDRYSWKIRDVIVCNMEDLDEKEKEFYCIYYNMGYEMRNKTGGGQGKGKEKTADYRPAKGYYDGIKQGEKNILKRIRLLAKYVEIKPKNSTKTAQRMYEELCERIGGEKHVEIG